MPRSLYTLRLSWRHTYPFQQVLAEALDTYPRRRSTVPVLGYPPLYLDVSSRLRCDQPCCPQLTISHRHAFPSHPAHGVRSATDNSNLHRRESEAFSVDRRSSRIHQGNRDPQLYKWHNIHSKCTSSSGPLNRGQSWHRRRHRRGSLDSPANSNPDLPLPPSQTPRRLPSPTSASRSAPLPTPLFDRHEHGW